MRNDTMNSYAVRGRSTSIVTLMVLLMLAVGFAWQARPAASAVGDWREDSCASTVVRGETGNIARIEHRGTSRSNICFGTTYKDIFWVGGGNDRIRSYDGPDEIHLSGGHDIAFGGEGDDIVWTGEGEDIAYGGGGNDYFEEKTATGGPDWDCYIAGPGQDNAYIQDGDDLVMDDYWGGRGTNDLYPQIDSFCDDGTGGCEQDGVYQVEDGPCKHDPNANCQSPGDPRDYCNNMATRT